LHTLNRSDVDAGELVKRTTDLIRPQASQLNVDIEVLEAQPQLPSVSADATRLEQVLLNLVMNALDQMKKGGKLTLAVEADSGAVTIHIADTGPGISDNIKNRIFDPYFTTRNEGMGMGLAVCDKIIQQHGGRIEFDSDARGTTFRVSLPIQATDESQDGASDIYDVPEHAST
jgi:two-component system nitrogen regulation sensor histidine kinase GlnL